MNIARLTCRCHDLYGGIHHSDCPVLARLAEAERRIGGLEAWLAEYDPERRCPYWIISKRTPDSASRPMQPAEQRECADITAHGVLCLRSLTRAPVDGCDCDRCRATSSASREADV